MGYPILTLFSDIRQPLVVYIFTQPLHNGEDVTQGQVLSRVKLVSNQSFPSYRLFAEPRLKNPVCPTIYP